MRRVEAILDKVKIGGLVYTVSKVEDLGHVLRSPGLVGGVDYHQLTIKLESEVNKDFQEQTFVHEVLHGIFVESGYEDHEEDMVNRIGKVLYQVLKENDFTFLRKG